MSAEATILSNLNQTCESLIRAYEGAFRDIGYYPMMRERIKKERDSFESMCLDQVDEVPGSREVFARNSEDLDRYLSDTIQLAWCIHLISKLKEIVMDVICTAATETWGERAQTDVAIGEIGEFLANIGRRAQGRANMTELVDEVADVSVMMRQMAIIYGKDDVEERIAFKFGRLLGKLPRNNFSQRRD